MSKKYTSKNFHLHYIPQYTLLIKTDFLVDTLLVLDESNHVQVLYSYPANQPDGDAIKLLGLPFQHIFINVPVRSEEHTSELQSRENLVCRLLLEKKK